GRGARARSGARAAARPRRDGGVEFLARHRPFQRRAVRARRDPHRLAGLGHAGRRRRLYAGMAEPGDPRHPPPLGTAMTTLLYTHPSCLAHDPGPHHPESPARLRAVLEALAAPEFAGLDRREAPEAALDDLARVHPRRLVDALLAAMPKEGYAAIDADTVLCPDSGKAALRAAGAAAAAVDAVVAGEAATAFCAVRPPGHHAGRGSRSSISTCITVTARRRGSPTTRHCSMPRPTNRRSIPAPGRRARPGSAISSTCRCARCRAPTSSAGGWSGWCCRRSPRSRRSW